jgi:aminopeptidase
LSTPSEQELRKYAELAVHVGLNLQAGQRLLVRAPIQTAPLVRLIAETAYRSGARLVSVIWSDEQLNLIRFQSAPRDSFAEFPNWLAQAFNEAPEQDAAVLSVSAEDPDILKDQDPELIALAYKTRGQRLKPFANAETSGLVNWAIISLPIPSWAARVFPDLPPEEQEARLWQAIARTCRLDRPDAVALWKKQIQDLTARRDYLTRKQYRALHLTAPGTDLTIGLPENHIWGGGQETTRKGISFTPNLPTEEVFTSPHKNKVDGTVRASKPLSYGGKLIENFSLTFAGGRVVNLTAGEGEATLRQLIATDEGAARLGEVALVPNSSLISQLGLLFYNTLFDENAASHIALGKAFKFAMQGGEALSDDEFAQAGGNDSLVHVDFMIGSGEMDVDGFKDGVAEPVMRHGEWAFKL